MILSRRRLSMEDVAFATRAVHELVFDSPQSQAEVESQKAEEEGFAFEIPE